MVINECKIYRVANIMFEHFRAILANKRNQKTLMMVGGFIILLIVLKHFGLYEGFKSKASKAKAKVAAAKAAVAKAEVAEAKADAAEAKAEVAEEAEDEDEGEDE